MMQYLHKHADEIKGTIGMVLSIGVPSIDSISITLRLLGGLGGLVLLILSIRHKNLQAKNEKIEIELKLKELKKGKRKNEA